jgi:hypothetical protein
MSPNCLPEPTACKIAVTTSSDDSRWIPWSKHSTIELQAVIPFLPNFDWHSFTAVPCPEHSENYRQSRLLTEFSDQDLVVPMSI